ncbi:MAG: RNA methyltransferase [Thermogutta sp.]|nr:RNA methyltransferase [Thermogutta sp.]
MAVHDRITSLRNPTIKAVRALRDGRKRIKSGRMIVHGLREISRAVAAGVGFEYVFFCPSLMDEAGRRLFEELQSRGAPLIEVTPPIIEGLAFGDRAEAVVAVAGSPHRELKDFRPARPDEPPLIAVVEGVEKPGNLGAVIRSADGAGAGGVIAADLRTDLFNPNVIRASLGTVFSMPTAVASGEEVLAWLRDRGIVAYAARVDAEKEYWQADFTMPSAIVLGNEAEGLSRCWSGPGVEPVRLPMLGLADSLNVSAAAAILLYEARRQRSRGEANPPRPPLSRRRF